MAQKYIEGLDYLHPCACAPTYPHSHVSDRIGRLSDINRFDSCLGGRLLEQRDAGWEACLTTSRRPSLHQTKGCAYLFRNWDPKILPRSHNPIGKKMCAEFCCCRRKILVVQGHPGVPTGPRCRPHFRIVCAALKDDLEMAIRRNLANFLKTYGSNGRTEGPGHG